MKLECPDGWRLASLRELGEINRGRSRHRPRYAEHLYGGPYPFIQTGDVRASNGRVTSHTQTYSEAGLAQSRLWPIGTMCITIAANIAETGILTFPACFPDSVVGFIAEPDQADVQFVEYMFRFLRNRIQHQATGSVQDNINIETLERLHFPVPPLAEQKAIATVLGALDDKIELNRRMNVTLEAMARTLFQSWFVDFDPVRAKLDGRHPAGLDEATAALFPASFHDSPSGHIPKGWTIEPVGNVIDCVGGGTPSTAEPKYWQGGTHHWTTPKDFSSLQAPVLLDTDRKLTDAGITKISSGLLPAGTLLFSSRAPVGYLAIAAMPVAINQGFIALKCNDRASNYFMLSWCQTNMAEIESRATGTTFAEISKHNFRPICIVLPPSELMAVFTAKVAPLYDKITANLHQSRTLATLRDTLLPKFLRGEVAATSINS